MQRMSARWRMEEGTGEKTRAAGVLLAGVSLIALIRPALAADLPITKAPPAAMAAPLSGWAGFYLGVNGGYGWAKDSYVDPVSLVTPTLHSINGVASPGRAIRHTRRI
jgi:opacity protein-like surface antigen